MRTTSKIPYPAALIYLYERGYRVREDGVLLNHKGRPTPCQTSADGYFYFRTKARSHPVHGNCSPTVYVHRLAAYQLFGDRIFDKQLQVCHCDGNSRNNAHDNLRLDTPSGNMLDIPKEKRIRKAVKAARCNSKLTDADVAYIRASDLKLKEIMERYGISKAGASYVRSGKTFKTLANAEQITKST